MSGMRLNAITIFPIKSLDGHSLSQADFLPSGALCFDRQFAFIDSEGQIMNAKRSPAFHRIQATYADISNNSLTVTLADRFEATSPVTISLPSQQTELCQWISDRLQVSVSLIHNQDVGFPDDLLSPGPTIISDQTLQVIAHLFQLSL